MGYAKIIGVFIFLYCSISRAQIIGSVELLSRLESMMKTFNSTMIQQQKQIDAIITDILIQQLTHDDDIKSLKKQLKAAEDKVTSIEKTVKENSNLITSANLQVFATEVLITEQGARIDKLYDTNKMWRSNFQVVNRTFGELRKKLAIVLPVVPA